MFVILKCLRSFFKFIFSCNHFFLLHSNLKTLPHSQCVVWNGLRSRLPNNDINAVSHAIAKVIKTRESWVDNFLFDLFFLLFLSFWDWSWIAVWLIVAIARIARSPWLTDWARAARWWWRRWRWSARIATSWAARSRASWWAHPPNSTWLARASVAWATAKFQMSTNLMIFSLKVLTLKQLLWSELSWLLSR